MKSIIRNWYFQSIVERKFRIWKVWIFKRKSVLALTWWLSKQRLGIKRHQVFFTINISAFFRHSVLYAIRERSLYAIVITVIHYRDRNSPLLWREPENGTSHGTCTQTHCAYYKRRRGRNADGVEFGNDSSVYRSSLFGRRAAVIFVSKEEQDSYREVGQYVTRVWNVSPMPMGFCWLCEPMHASHVHRIQVHVSF